MPAPGSRSEPPSVRAIGRRAVGEAVLHGGRWALASAIRIVDGAARPIDVERLQRVAPAWRFGRWGAAGAGARALRPVRGRRRGFGRASGPSVVPSFFPWRATLSRTW